MELFEIFILVYQCSPQDFDKARVAGHRGQM